MQSRKVIVTVAPTGGILSKTDNPNCPTQPQEIAEVVAECCELGASIAALHIRNPDDTPTCNPAIYSELNQMVRDRCDIIINNSTGGGAWGDMVREMLPGRWEIPFDERVGGVQGQPAPEMATFDAESVFVSWKGKELLFDTSPSRCDELAKMMHRRNIKPEWEVMDAAHILQDVTRLIKLGMDKPPFYVNIVLGLDKVFQGALPYTPKILQFMVDLLPANSLFCVSAMGPAQLPATTQAILLGGHIRVGLEDNSFYSKGQLTTNQELVARAVRIIRELGCEPATPGEAREMLGLQAPVLA